LNYSEGFTWSETLTQKKYTKMEDVFFWTIMQVVMAAAFIISVTAIVLIIRELLKDKK